MTEFEGQVLADLSVLKSQMEQLMGIGQPGRLTQIEERVERHERRVQRMKGCWRRAVADVFIWRSIICDVRQEGGDGFLEVFCGVALLPG